MCPICNTLCPLTTVLYTFQADVIMALAGSNGGSWSTTYSPKSTVRPAGEGQIPIGEVETGNANSMPLPREYHRGRLCIPGSSSQGVGFGDRLSTPAGDLFNLIFYFLACTCFF